MAQSVLSACRVSSNFHARYLARARTYVYRVATGCTTYSDLPVFERDLCWANWRGNLRFWELEFVSRSFLYKQVRRMVGALVAIGQSRLQPHHIQELLAARDLMAYPPNIMAPPDGLFLKHVEYYQSDLETED
ncbi:PREDICTED: tRNA pseudouridine synthase-like 1 [Thamnophis sirtalis]|uniref:tRNA pseudouridine synthase n=1 Tax=Thamnophis sirtalis TaxID=35019 RepID=A0A6I9XZ58_9SAUR|nr:PREDICTED: tRNA pseudouridine synthase-like 1 [Thamnophis sirtalis]